MKEYWAFRIGKEAGEVNASFDEDYLVVSSGSELYCLDVNGLLWKRRMTTTFYRDPFSDVRITALDTENSIIAAGTNFMDGKMYLLTKTGRLLWEHQFATIASLGWRPEDVTAIGLGDNCVAAGTEFIGEYVYIYTLERKRLFQKRVEGTVRGIAINGKIVVGTDRRLYVYNRNGKEELSIPAQSMHVKILNNKIVAAKSDGLVIYGRDRVLEKSIKEPIFSSVGDNIAFACGNEVCLMTDEGGEIWSRSLDSVVKLLYCSDDKIYAVVDDGVIVLSGDGRLIERVEFDGNPVSMGRIGILVHECNVLRLYPLPG